MVCICSRFHRCGSCLVRREKGAEGKELSAYRGIQWVREGILPYPRHGSCVHYEPAVFRKGKRGDSGNGEIVKPAQSYLIKSGTGRSVSWHCAACGMAINDRHRKKLQQIVEYLNQGGDDGKKLAAMFSGVEIGELVQCSPREMRLTCGAGCPDGFVPPKNRCL